MITSNDFGIPFGVCLSIMDERLVLFKPKSIVQDNANVLLASLGVSFAVNILGTLLVVEEVL